MKYELGTFVRSTSDELFTFRVGEIGQITGFLLNASGVDVEVSDCSGLGFSDTVPAHQLAHFFEPVEDSGPTLH
jgi:hypothetical protein